MSFWQRIITIGLCVAGTMLTRYLPFLLFSSKKPTPAIITYLGRALPCAVFGMLVVYSLKGVEWTSGFYGMPEGIAVLCTVLLHLWRKQMMLSIAGGTICYMLLVQMVFI